MLHLGMLKWTRSSYGFLLEICNRRLARWYLSKTFYINTGQALTLDNYHFSSHAIVGSELIFYMT